MFRSFLGFFKPSLDEAQSRSNDNQEHRHATTSLLEEPDQPGPGSEPEDNDNVSSVGSPLISSDDIIGDMQQSDVSSDSSSSEDEYGEGEPNVLQERDNQEVQVESENEEAPNVSDEDAEIQQNGGLVVEVVDLTGDLSDSSEEDVGHVQPNNTGPEEDEQATDDNLNEIPLPELTLIDSADASQHSSSEDAEDFLRDTVMRSYEELSSSSAGDDMGSLDEADITQEPIQVAVSEPRVLEEFSSSDDEVVPEMETSSEPEVPLTAEEQAQISFRNSVMRSYEELSSSSREDNIVDLDEASISQQVEQLPLEVPKQGSLEEMSSSSEEVVSERDEPESIPEAIPSPPPEPLEDDLPSQEEVPSDPELSSQDLEVSTDGQVLSPVEVQPSDHESISDGISEEEAQVFSDHIPSDDEIDADTTSSPTQQPQTSNEAPIGGTEQAPQSSENSEELPQQPQQEEVQGVTSNVSRKRTHTEVGSGDESESEPELEGERNENHEVPDFGQPIEDTEPTTEIQEAPQLRTTLTREPQPQSQSPERLQPQPTASTSTPRRVGLSTQEQLSSIAALIRLQERRNTPSVGREQREHPEVQPSTSMPAPGTTRLSTKEQLTAIEELVRKERADVPSQEPPNGSQTSAGSSRRTSIPVEASTTAITPPLSSEVTPTPTEATTIKTESTPRVHKKRPYHFKKKRMSWREDNIQDQEPDHSHEPATATDSPSSSTTTSQSTPGSLREDADSSSPGNGSRQRTDSLESPANILEARDRDDEAGSSPENPSRVSLSQSQESELDTAAAQIQAVGAVTEERSELANDNHDVPNGGNQTPTIPVEGDDLPDFDDDISVQDNGEASGEFTTPTAQSVPEKRVSEGDDSLPIERSSKRRKLDDHDPANDSQVDLETPHDRPHNDSQVAEASKGTDLCSEAETSRLLPPPVMDSRSDATIRPLTENLSGPIAPEETEDTQSAHIAETTTASVEVVNEGTVNGIDKPDNAQVEGSSTTENVMLPPTETGLHRNNSHQTQPRPVPESPISDVPSDYRSDDSYFDHLEDDLTSYIQSRQKPPEIVRDLAIEFFQMDSETVNDRLQRTASSLDALLQERETVRTAERAHGGSLPNAVNTVVSDSIVNALSLTSARDERVMKQNTVPSQQIPEELAEQVQPLTEDDNYFESIRGEKPLNEEASGRAVSTSDDDMIFDATDALEPPDGETEFPNDGEGTRNNQLQEEQNGGQDVSSVRDGHTETATGPAEEPHEAPTRPIELDEIEFSEIESQDQSTQKVSRQSQRPNPPRLQIIGNVARLYNSSDESSDDDEVEEPPGSTIRETELNQANEGPSKPQDGGQSHNRPGDTTHNGGVVTEESPSNGHDEAGAMAEVDNTEAVDVPEMEAVDFAMEDVAENESHLRETIQKLREVVERAEAELAQREAAAKEIIEKGEGIRLAKERRIESLRQETEDLRQQLVEAERSIETEKEARESTEQRLRGLEQSYEQRLTELERTLATAESDAANEKREWESAQSEREKEVAQLTQQLASAKESLETEKEQRREIQEKLKEAVKWGERAMDLATDKVAEYVRELGLRRSAEGRIEELRKHIESLQASEVAIKEDVQKEKDERQHIEEELCKAQAENADLAKRLGATKYDLTVMTTSREAMRRESERLQWEVAGLTQELISTKSSIIKARAARQQAEKEATDLRGQNEALENKASELSGKLETVMEANKDAEEMVLSANNAHEAAEEKLRELSLQKTIAETEAQKEIDQLTSEVSEMREALRRETTTREAKEREAAALVHEVSGIKADLAIQRIRRVQADEKVDELTRREAQVRKAMEDEVTKRMQTEEENAQLALRISESESSAENERRAVEATERENEELKLQVASHQQLALELATRKEMEVRERQARELSEQKVEGLHEKLRATKEDVEIKIQQLTSNSQMLQKTIQKVREVEEEADRRTTEFLEKTALVTETADKERASRENAKEKCKQLTFELIDIKSTIQREKKARVYAEENNKSLTLRLIEEKSATQSERRAKERAEQLALEENLGNQAEKQRMTTELAQLQAALETERDERQKVAAERATIQAKLEEVTAICAQLRVHLSQEVTAAKKLVEDEKAARESSEISLQQTVAELRNQVANLFRKQIASLAAGMAVQKDFVESMAAELAQKEYKDPDDPMDVGEENSLSITREEDNELATGTRRESLATGSTSETECSAMIVEVLKEYDSMMREESAGERNFENYWVLNSPLPEEARQYEPQVQQLQQTAENRESESQRQFSVTLQVPMNRRIDTAQAFSSERNADRTGQVNGSQQSNHSWDGSLQDSDSEFARELDEKYQRLHGTSSSRHISKMMSTDNHPIEEDQSNNDEEPVYSESVDTGTTSSSSANSQGFDATSQASNGVVQSASIDPRELSYIEREAASRVNPNSSAIIYSHFSGKREANETAEEQRTAPQKDATIETVSEASTTIRKEVPHGRRNPATKDSAIRRYISSGKHRSAIEAHIRSASTRRDGTVRNIRNADNPTGIATALPTVVERIGGVEKVVVDLTIDSESEENDENDTTGNSRPLSPKVISRRGQKKQDGRVGKAGLISTTRNNRKKSRVEDENPMGNKAEREGERSGEYESTATPDKEESAPEETSAVTSKESSGTANESNNKSHEEVSLISRIKSIYLGKSDGNSDRESAQSAEIYPLATIDSIDKFSFRPWHRAAYFSKDSRSEIDESGTSESGTSESEASESGTSESEDEMDFAVRHRKSNRKTTNLRVKHDEIREQLVPCETSEPSTPQRLDNMLDEILAGSVKRKSNPKSKANRAKARKRGRQSRKGKSTKA